MLRKTIRLSGALVLALALAGAAPAAALDMGGRNLGVWDTVWNWVAGLFGPSDQGSDGNSGSLTRIWEGSTTGFDPNGQPLPQGGNICEVGETTCGFDPNG
jgi:hypothetical protein